MGKVYVDGGLKSTWAQFAHGDSGEELKDSLMSFVKNVILAPYGEYSYVLDWFQERAEELGRCCIMREDEVREFREWSWRIFKEYGFVDYD